MAKTKLKLRSLSDMFLSAAYDAPRSMSNDEKDSPPSKPSFSQVLGSVLAGALGVQSSKNRERDFSQNSFLPYIIGGIIFTVAFVGGLALLVSLLLNQ